MTAQLTRQSIVEESLSVELSSDQQAQFDKLEGPDDKAAYLEALLSDEEADVKVVNRHEFSEITHIREDGEDQPTAVAKADFTDELESRRKGAMPKDNYQVRFAEIGEDGVPVKTTETIEATSYADAVSTLFQNAAETGRMIDRVFPGAGQEPPALIQLDRNVYDLTAGLDNETTFHVGAIGLQIARQGQDLSVVMSNTLTGEELDCMSISDADYKELLDPSLRDSGPSLG